MQTVPLVKQKVYQTLDALPPQGLKELSRLLDFLKYLSAW